MVECEGLGPLADRTFLTGTVPDWQAADDLEFAPATVFSPLAASRARELGRRHGAVDARPDGTVSTPEVGLITRGQGAPRVLGFDAGEHDIPGPIAGLRVADAWVFSVEHWTGLLWANLLALGPFLWGELVGSPWRLAWASLLAGSTRPEEVAAKLTRSGRGARVHRSATVEGCWLGEGVVVGAGAVVRGCVLGKGCVVEELSLVEGCVLGRGVRVQRMAMAKYSLLETESTHAGIMQLGVLGRGAVVKHGAILMDMPLGRDARVWRAGRLVAAPRGMVGVCVGEGATLGQGVRVAPGRAVPRGVTILSPGDDIVRDVAVPAGATRLRVRGGALEPVG